MKGKTTINRRLMIMVSLLLCTICMFRGTGARAESKKPLSSPEEAAEFIELLFGDKPDSLNGMYDLTPDMEKAISSSGGWGGLVKQLASLGEAEKIGPAYADKLKGRDVLRVPCSFSVYPIDLVFVLEDGAIAGLITDKYTGGAEEDSEEAKEGAFVELDLAVPVPGLNGELPGTLTLPEGDGPFPVVVLVHGSGPCNRDEETASVKPFKDLAEGLAEKGIAVYRYDKRTYVYGEQIASDVGFTLMEETVDDAAATVQAVSGQDKIDPERIIVLGHSLGAMAVPEIDRELKKDPVKAAGYILMAPPARDLDELMRDQYEFLLSLEPELGDEQAEEKERIFGELDRLQNLKELPDDEQIAGAYVPYWKWLKAYDPLEVADGIELPCLLLQGEEDYQVTMEDYERWEEAVGKKPNWKLILYPDLVHAFVPGQKAEGQAVYLKGGHVDPQVIQDIADFVL